MPYAEIISGIYRLVNTHTNACYVGQSQNIKKRVAEHFRLLRLGKHSNPHLQNSFNKYGEEAFTATVEVLCEDFDEIDMLENAFISGAACFDTPVAYNIADFAKAPMRGKRHTEATREKIRDAKRKSGFDYSCKEWRKSLSEGQLRRAFSDPERVAKIRFILENDHLSYTERARRLNMAPTSVRKLYLKYNPIRNKVP